MSCAPSIDHLPDNVLVQCFGYLDLKDRVANKALVCRRWRSLSHSPELLREVAVDVTVNPLVQAQALEAWLTRHAAQVQRLGLNVKPWEIGKVDVHIEPIKLILSRCLHHCGTHGQLEELTLDPDTPVPPTAWLPAMSRLQRLSLGAKEFGGPEVVLTPGAEVLTRLVSLRLEGHRVDVQSQLPTSLTALTIGDYVGHTKTMPAQLAELPNLARLQLCHVEYSVPSMQALTTLSSSLTRLGLMGCPVPDCLSALTKLSHLQLDWVDEGDDSAEAVEAALGQLTQLTCLFMAGENFEDIPPAVGGLPRLQRLNWWQGPGIAGLELDCRLPGGPWLHSIRWLGTNWSTLAHSVDILAAAERLEYVAIGDVPTPPPPQLEILYHPSLPPLVPPPHMSPSTPQAQLRWDGFWTWARTHPPLRRICLDVSDKEPEDDDPPFPHKTVDEILHLMTARPGFLVHRSGAKGHPRFMDEMCGDC